MSEERDMEKTPVVCPEAAPEVKEAAKPPMEKEETGLPAEKAEAGLPAEKEPAGLPAEKEKAQVPAAAAEEAEEVHVDSPEPDMEINIIDDRDKEAEGLIRWAAGRAGVIVAAPLLGTAALVANEVYMISKIGTVYGVELNQKAVLSFFGSLGATVVGSTLATLIPISFMQIPIGVSVTYGIGKAAQRWIKDGMPDDTKPYRAVFEEEKAEGEKDVKELEENPKKDEPLGDEKKDFTAELKKNWNDVYPEKAHEAVDKLARQLTESAGMLGNKLVDALKKAGVTDEQIEKAKYTALGASEVAQETAEKTARDLQAIARIKSREFRKDAARRADEMKAQARVQMQEARIQATKLKIQAQEQAETAQAKAQEISDKVMESAGRYRDAAVEAATQAKADMMSTAEEYRAKIEERARQKQAEAAERDGKSVEGAGKAEETASSPDEKTKSE